MLTEQVCKQKNGRNIEVLEYITLDITNDSYLLLLCKRKLHNFEISVE